MLERTLVSCVFGVAFLVRNFVVPQAWSEEAFDINTVLWCKSGQSTGHQTEAECIESRTIILTHCTSCHAITPIVKAQKDSQGWAALLKGHRSRVPDIDEKDLAKIQRFLEEHYNPKNPVPTLPPELEALGVPPA